MARIWIEYIAGFIDAEGSIGIYPRKRTNGTIDWVPHISVVNTDLNVMNLIAEALGGTIRVKTHNRLGTKTIYTLHWTHKKAREVTKKIYPFLIIKKEKARIIKDFPACSGTFAPKDLQDKKAKQERLYNKFLLLTERVVV